MLKDMAYITAAAIEILLPLILAFIMWKKFKVSWAIFFLGMVLFLASLIRIPLNTYLSNLLQSRFQGEAFYILIGIVAGLTAGIFEEGVRVLAFGAVIKPRDYHKGIMYGIGHGGGGEAMIFVGFTTLANFIIYKFFPSILPANTIPQIQAALWWLPFVGAMERISAITIQIAFSVLIMYAFMSKKYYFIVITILLHMIVDFTAFYINYKFGMWYSELSAFIFALAGIAAIVLLKPKDYRHALENY
jgi:uncharacterized membrane protein YhfC